MKANHTILLLVATLALTGMSAGCGDEATAPFANIAWQLRCPEDGMGDCPQDGLPQMVTGFDGENGNIVDCEIADAAPNKFLRFTARNEAGDGVSLSATFPDGGGAVIGTNNVQVFEGSNTFAGRGGSNQPSPEVPCQVNPIRFGDSDNGQTVSGEVICRNLPGTVAMNLLRDVGRAGSEAGSMDMPFAFTFSGCTGLE